MNTERRRCVCVPGASPLGAKTKVPKWLMMDARSLRVFPVALNRDSGTLSGSSALSESAGAPRINYHSRALTS